MQNVMTIAWGIARNGQHKFGGKVKEYFSEALRIAWRIVKKEGMKDIQLKGSEKQIKWASEIRDELIQIYEESKKNFIERRKANDTWDEERHGEPMKLIEKHILNNDSASFYIDRFGYALDKGAVLRDLAADLCKEHKVSIVFARKI